MESTETALTGGVPRSTTMEGCPPYPRAVMEQEWQGMEQRTIAVGWEW